MNNAGKGDKQRPTDIQRYQAQYEKIFGKNKQSLPQVPTEPVVVKNNAKKQ